MELLAQLAPRLGANELFGEALGLDRLTGCREEAGLGVGLLPGLGGECRTDAALGPLEQTVAVEALPAALLRLVAHVVLHRDADREFEILVVVPLANLRHEERLQVASGSGRDLLHRELHAELLAGPIGERLGPITACQEALAIGKIDAANRGFGLLHEPFSEFLGSDLLEVAFAALEPEASVHGPAHLVPLPVARLLIRVQVLFGEFLDHGGNHLERLVQRGLLGIVVAASELGGRELDAEAVAGELGETRRAVILGEELIDGHVRLLVDHVEDHGARVLAVEHFLPRAVDALALVIHHLVVFEQVLALVEVVLFDLLLGLLDAAGDHAGFDGFAFLHAEAGEDVGDPLAGEEPHEVVLKREVEAGRTGVALAAGATAKLVVDAAALVALGADDVEPAHLRDLAALFLHLLLALDFVNRRGPDIVGNLETGRVERAAVCVLGLLQASPGEGLRVAAENDVRAAASHVRADGHGAEPTGLRHDLGFARNVLRLRVQEFVLDAAAAQHARELLALGHVRGADEDGPAALVRLLDLADHRVPLLAIGAVDEVPLVHAPHGHVRRNGHDVELVDLPELGGFGHRGSGHAAELPVQAEVVLQRDGGEGLRLLLDLDAFLLVLGFDGLVKPVGPLAAEHGAAGELVDDDDAELVLLARVFRDHVVAVEVVQVVRLQRVVDEVRPLHVPGCVEALDPGQKFRLAHASIRQVAGAFLLLDLEVDALGRRVRRIDLTGIGRRERGQAGPFRSAEDHDAGIAEVGAGLAFHLGEGLRNLIRLGEAAGIRERRTADDQRRSRFVDQDVVDFVDDRVVQRDALHLAVVRVVAAVVVAGDLHVVAEVVEAELAVGAIGDVALVGGSPGLGLHIALDVRGVHAQRVVNGEHPLAVAAREVVVHRDHVNALLRERVQVRGERGDEGFAFARHHFGNGTEAGLVAVEDGPADDLDVVVAHALVAAGGLAAGGERLDEQVVERFAGLQPIAERRGLLLEFVIGKGGHPRFEFVHFRENRTRDGRVNLGVLGPVEPEALGHALAGRPAEHAGDEAHDSFGEGSEPIADAFQKARLEFGLRWHSRSRGSGGHRGGCFPLGQ